MKITAASLKGVLVIEPKYFSDSRGFFMETYSKDIFRDVGINLEFVQDNHSGSQKGVLRGLHYQIKHPQGKLVRVVKGAAYDVAVDLRKSSPTFGQHTGIILSAENRKQVWVPPGFAHGFYVLSDWAEIIYKVTDIYAPEWERTILWNDPDLNINWPLAEDIDVLVSEKDSKGVNFLEAELYN